MAHLWFPESVDDGAAGAAWTLRPLDGGTALDADTRVMLSAAPDGDRWVLLGAPAVRVNGSPVDTGILVLRDRDEICAGAQRLFFSTEQLAVVAPYPGAVRPAFCPRCKLEIESGSPAVACPRCRVWHHQSDDLLPCWTYSGRCALCDQVTALDADFQWTPEEL